jgi:hypothetical protein
MKNRDEFKTIDIKGKKYVEVDTRVQYFRENKKYEGWSLITEIVELTEKRAVLKAVITNPIGIVMATGLAYENVGSSYINKTSYVENCETSAWGRALGNLGIGITESIASYEEVANAIAQQEEKEIAKLPEVKKKDSTPPDLKVSDSPPAIDRLSRMQKLFTEKKIPKECWLEVGQALVGKTPKDLDDVLAKLYPRIYGENK